MDWSPTFSLLLMLTVAQPGEEAPARLDPNKDFVHVCRDAGAGGYEAFPDVCRLADGRLLCVFYAGWQHVSLPDEAHPRGGRISGCFSSDEGATWSPAFTVYDSSDDDRDPSVVQLADGRILCNFFILRKTADKWRGLGSWLVESADGGATWSAARPVSPYYSSSPVRVLAMRGDSAETLVLGLYEEHGGDAWGAVTLSQDGGRSWSPPVDIPNGGLRLDAETDVVELNDGRLYAIQRTATEDMRYAVSEDRGRSWTVSAPVGFPGHSPYLHRTPAGPIVCAHRLPQTSLHYSADECKTWSGNVLIDNVAGAYPSMVNLRDGSVLVVYYEEGENSSIRARKFRLDGDGLRWLGW